MDLGDPIRELEITPAEDPVPREQPSREDPDHEPLRPVRREEIPTPA